ncbi:hypothetical protein ACFQ77_27130 [Streptomyces virginiae]|uniref:hypothetical protein n=1 Tax=Streptomyces virginiae TaxID=1961 RepID=UPI0036814B1C
MANHKMRAARQGDEDDGLLGKMRTAQLPDAEHPTALATVDRLLAVVGGTHRIGQTWRRTVLRGKPLSER